MVEPLEFHFTDGRTVPVHLGGSDDPSAPVLVMHYGTPHSGRHLAPVEQVAAEVGLRLVSIPRPGMAGSPRRAGRSVADVAGDVAEVLARLDIDRAAMVGYSGGGPHALACAALLDDRVSAVAAFASPAPFDGTEDWFAGMYGDGGGLRPASRGRVVREEFQTTAEFDPTMFAEVDWTALAGTWSVLGADAEAAGVEGSDAGEIDDDLAFVAPWGVDLGTITSPVTLFHGTADRVIPVDHARRLGQLMPTAATEIIDGAGHVAVLESLPGWVRELRAG